MLILTIALCAWVFAPGVTWDQNIRVALISVILGYIASWWLAYNMNQNLDKIMEGAERVARGNPIGTLGVNSRERIGDLAEKFEWMARTIENTKRQHDDVLTRYKESAARHEIVVQMAADGIITARPGGDIRSFNKAAEAILGYKAKEVVSPAKSPRTMRLWHFLPEPSKLGAQNDTDRLLELLRGYGVDQLDMQSPNLEVVGRR